MKPRLLKVAGGAAQSFSVRRDITPYVNNRWHYHKEIELIHFEKGHGTQFVGDSIRPFKEGDVVLVGSQLPHYWCFDDAYFKPACMADVRVSHFSDIFWGEQFLNLPENKKLKNLLGKARQGVLFRGPAAQAVAKLMEDLLTAEGSQKIVLLLKVLTSLAEGREGEMLSSIGFNPGYDDTDMERLSSIYEYSLLNFKRKITLDEVAKLANLSLHSFCRYFKRKANKTYTQFITEIRVGYACKLLLENSLPARLVCNESGFNNFTSFHKYFKATKGMSPGNYQKVFIHKSKA